MIDCGLDGRATRGHKKAWLRALERTAPIAGAPHRVLPSVIDELAEERGEAPALLSERECLTYRALAERARRYARWALDQGLAKGDRVCLLMPNRPEYMAIWLGITSVGGIVSLLNTNLVGSSLAHCVDIVAPKRVIVAEEFVGALRSMLTRSALAATIWVQGAVPSEFPGIDRALEGYGCDRIRVDERRSPTIEDCALYIYTSGTTGLPKAAKVSHFRLMQWSHWFAGMMNIFPTDRMYNCLPMYHSVGGVLATGAMLVGGGSVVIRDRFSVRRFWEDVNRWDCTLFQYIGELCRYLLHAAPTRHDKDHRIRMACGNGLRADIWNAFKTRFGIPDILEFYAATEDNVSLFNVEGKPGAVGRIPAFLAHRASVALVRVAVDREEPLRDDNGHCIRCGRNEIGEATGRIRAEPSTSGGRFEGYIDPEASEKKIVRNVFEPGDVWFRTGDLMRQDEDGYFYFVDRIGDTFRWKGENVSTLEVEEVICAFPGIEDANVYGVRIPDADGRAGMAALVVSGELDLAAFRRHLDDRLPRYARPLFLRIRNEMALTGTFKHTKKELVLQRCDPTVTTDAMYLDDRAHEAFVRLDRSLYDRIQSGQLRPW